MKANSIFKTMIVFVALLCFYSADAQTEEKIKYDVIKLQKVKLERDSTLETHNLITSVRENIVLPKLDHSKSFTGYSVDFYPEHKTGVFYVLLNGADENPRSRLYLYASDGKELYSIKAKTRLNEVNMRNLPPGNYLLTIDVDEEISTWEVVKQ